MIYSTIRSEIRTRLEDPDGKVFDDGDLLRTTNDVLDDIALSCEAHLRHESIDLTASTRTYALPDDCYELRGAKLNYKKLFGTSASRLEEFDTQYLYTTGTPQRYYLEDLSTIALHPIPTWTSSYTTFTSDLGELIEWTVDGTEYTFDSELGVVIDVLDTTGGVQYFLDQLEGVVVAIDTAFPRLDVAYIYQPARLVNDSDTPDLPTHVQWMLIYGVLEALFESESQAQNLILAAYWGARYEELKKEWRARNIESMHAPDQYLSQMPTRWGSDLDWRERTNP